MSSVPNIIKETSEGYRPIAICDELLKSREVFLTDNVCPASMESLFQQLLHLSREDPEAPITLYINSPGGEVSCGMAVYDYMQLIPAPIRTVCIGTASSMGAILFLAGDERIMFPSSRIMIHDPAFGNSLKPGMKPLELEERLDHLKKIRKETADIISSVTGRPLEEILEKTSRDSYFDAKEAVDFGLATTILTKDTIGSFIHKQKGNHS